MSPDIDDGRAKSPLVDNHWFKKKKKKNAFCKIGHELKKKKNNWLHQNVYI